MDKCCDKCSKSEFALKGNAKKAFGGVCGLACDCHTQDTKQSLDFNINPTDENIKAIKNAFREKHAQLDRDERKLIAEATKYGVVSGMPPSPQEPEGWEKIAAKIALTAFGLKGGYYLFSECIYQGVKEAVSQRDTERNAELRREMVREMIEIAKVNSEAYRGTEKEIINQNVVLFLTDFAMAHDIPLLDNRTSHEK